MSEQSATLSTPGQSGALPVPRRWPRRQVLLGVAILLCGIAIGASGGTIVTGKITKDQIRGAWLQPGRTHTFLLKRIQEKLGLSPEQTKQVEPIVARRTDAVRQIMDRTRPQVYAEFDLMKAEVAQVLNEQQAREWDRRFGELLRGHRSSRGPHRGGSRDGRDSDREKPGDRGPGPSGDAKDRPPPPPSASKPGPPPPREPQ